MGIARERFCFAPSDDIICSVCSGVLKDAVNFKKCNHLVCRGCLDQLKCITTKYLCATCSKYSAIKELHPLLKKLIDQWPLKCKYADNGCNFVTSVLNDDAHATECKFNPWRKDSCKECGFTGFIYAKHDHHNCVKYLLQELKIAQFEIEKLKRDQIVTSGSRRLIRAPNFHGSSDLIIDKDDEHYMKFDKNDLMNIRRRNLTLNNSDDHDIKSSLSNFYNRRMEQMQTCSLRIKNNHVTFSDDPIIKSNTLTIANNGPAPVTRPPRRKVPPPPAPSPPARRTRSQNSQSQPLDQKHQVNRDYHKIVMDMAHNILSDGDDHNTSTDTINTYEDFTV